jgi:hypothetical protein
MLIHLPREDGWGVMPRTKNGPALAGYGAITMSNALAATITTLPDQLRRLLTWDRGKELSAHARFTVETGVPVFFADPHSPRQRGTNENTPTACCGSTFRKAPTCPDGVPKRSMPSPTRSTADPGNARLEDSRRSPRPTPTIAPTTQYCDDWLNPP